jgi:hypothetical protein
MGDPFVAGEVPMSPIEIGRCPACRRPKQWLHHPHRLCPDCVEWRPVKEATLE